MQIISTQFVIIGAGIHGLSTAYRLAKRLKACGAGTGADITVGDKENIAAGASGIACGVIRNNFFQPAMRALMAHSVSIWEQHTEILHYHPVGYMQISPESMHEDVAQIAKEQADIGYPSQLIEGSEDCMSYMRGLFSDWRAEGITSVLHETSGGYANNAAAIKGLAALAEAEGVWIQYPVTVEGFEKDQTGTVTGVVTNHGTIHCEQVIIGADPWAKQMWDLLQLPKTISVQDAQGNTQRRANVDLLVVARRHAWGRSRVSKDRCGRSTAGHSCRLKRTSLLDQRRTTDHRHNVGYLLQTGLQFRWNSRRCSTF